MVTLKIPTHPVVTRLVPCMERFRADTGVCPYDSKFPDVGGKTQNLNNIIRKTELIKKMARLGFAQYPLGVNTEPE